MSELATAAENEKKELKEQYDERIRELMDEKIHLRNDFEDRLSHLVADKSEFETEVTSHFREERERVRINP